MRVLQIIPSLSPVTGGPAKSIPAICAAADRLGHDALVFTSDWPISGGQVNKPLNKKLRCKVRVFPAESGWMMPELPYSPSLVDAVIRVMGSFDCVINHSLWNPVASFVMRALRKRRVHYCLFTHGMLDPIVLRRHRLRKALWAGLWERANVEGASLVVFNTRAEEEKARECGWRFQQTMVLPHALDLTEWKDLPAREEFDSRYPLVRGRELILFVGRIDWVKNLDILIAALTVLRSNHPDAILACVGPDNNGYRAELELLAGRLGVKEHLLFTGMLEEEELKAAYARAEVFALVSKKENFGLAAAEALACGLPVVLSEGVGLARDLPQGGPLLRVEPTPEAIAGALERQLQRGKSRGLPDSEARLLAEARLGHSPLEELFAAYEAAIR